MKIKDKDIQLLVGQLLRYGVFIASGIVLLGGLLYIYLYGATEIPAYQVFAPIKDQQLFRSFQWDARSCIEIGVLVLIATPILRVIFSLFAFALEKDKLYVVITMIVLSIVIFNIIYGVAD